LLGTASTRESVSWSSERLRVYVLTAVQLQVDSRAISKMAGLFGPRHAQVTLQLEGELITRRHANEATIASGMIGVEPSLVWDERWQGTRFRTLVVEWSDELGGMPTGFDAARLSPSDRAEVADIADAVQYGAEPLAHRAISRLCLLLRSLGVPVETRDELSLVPDHRAIQTMADRLSAMRSNLHQQPMWVDAVQTAARSERQLRRDLSRALIAAGVPGRGLRELLLRERLVAAIILLGAPEGRVDQVAASCGYGSSRALGLALEQAGLATASEIRASTKK